MKRLKEEEVPVIVCLTHADRLYVECIEESDDNNPHPSDDIKRIIGSDLYVSDYKIFMKVCSRRGNKQCAYGQRQKLVVSLAALRFSYTIGFWVTEKWLQSHLAHYPITHYPFQT